jgi:hypothetical protein
MTLSRAGTALTYEGVVGESTAEEDPSPGPSPFGLMIHHIFLSCCERLAVI